jgi:hypothetical protein
VKRIMSKMRLLRSAVREEEAVKSRASLASPSVSVPYGLSDIDIPSPPPIRRYWKNPNPTHVDVKPSKQQQKFMEDVSFLEEK